MHFDRSRIGPPICIYLFLLFPTFLSANDERTEGRKCVCTSKDCKEANVDTCKTKYFCYTEFILSGNQEFKNITTRGCTEGATPLLCETKSWVKRSKSSDNADRPLSARIRMLWSRLKCCDSHDYCNADHRANASTWIHDRERANLAAPTLDYAGSSNETSPGPEVMGPIRPDLSPIVGGRESSDQFPQNRVKPLHVAALVLAIAALISVLAACYVITRFLKTNPYTVGSVEPMGAGRRMNPGSRGTRPGDSRVIEGMTKPNRRQSRANNSPMPFVSSCMTNARVTRIASHGARPGASDASTRLAVPLEHTWNGKERNDRRRDTLGQV